MKRLSLKDQGELYYILSASIKPKLFVKPGETFIIETEDAFSGQIRKEGDRRDLEKIPYSNPVSGPIFIENATPNDTLIVEIKDIKPLIGQGATRIPDLSFYFSNIPLSKFLHLEVPHGTKICPIKDGKVFFDKYILPYNPMIGTIGVAPKIESISSNNVGPHGGNLDLLEITIGSKIFFPIYNEGALLFVGDVHAIQGEGELCGTAIEMPAEVTLKVDLIKNYKIDWPRIETNEEIGVICVTGINKNLEDAIKTAFIELILWLEEKYGINKWDAYQLCTQIAKVSLGNFWTVTAKVPKKILEVSFNSS